MDEMIQVFSRAAGRPPTEAEYEQLQILMRKRGGECARSIELIFSKDFQWVRNDKLAFLINETTWVRHLVPALAYQPTSSGGEQAEFGVRPEGHGYRREW